MTREANLLFSAYPVSLRLRRRLEERCGVRFTVGRTLSELKRLSSLGLIRHLTGLRADTLWILVSDRGYQPFLPLLRLLASLTRARRLRVLDAGGSSQAVGRTAILLLDPLRIAYGSLSGLWSLARVRREVARLLRIGRVEAPCGSAERRVAYLKPSLWLGVQAGGSVGHVAGVVNALSRSGCPVDVYTVEAPPMLDPEVSLQPVRVKSPVGVPLDLIRFSFQRDFADEAVRLLEGRRPRFVYQRHTLASYAGVVVSRRLGLPLLLEYNGSEVWAARNWGLPLQFDATVRGMEEVSLRHAHLIVVVSEVLREELLGRGIAAERIVYHPNGFDARVFDPSRFDAAETESLRRQWDLSAEATVCLFLGTFGPWHGSEVLAEAVRRLAAGRPAWLERHEVRFLFVGDGQRLPRVREILAEVPSHLYRLTGLVPQEEAPRYLAAADILLSPHVPNPDGSRFFGSPTKLFEYMAMGKAIVASELEQIGQVLAGSHHVRREGPPADEERVARGPAVLTTPGSPEDLVAALEYLVPRRDLRGRLGRAARERALARFTWERAVSAFLGRLQEIEGAPGGPQGA